MTDTVLIILISERRARLDKSLASSRKSRKIEIFVRRQSRLAMSAVSDTSMYYSGNAAYYCRLPRPYASDDYLRPLSGFTGRRLAQLGIYLINDIPPVGPGNTALGGLSSNSLVSVYVPKGSIANYINNSNTGWREMYDAGRLIEVKYNIIED